MSSSHAPPEFDPALIARYDKTGPRYTSYPTIPQFRSDFDERSLRSFIRMSNDDLIPPSLSLYVHIPFCANPCFYCGCNRVITQDFSEVDRYLQHLHREIELIAPLFDRDRTVQQLHFGGGTPNCLDLSQLRGLMDVLAEHFNFARECELGIELDPRHADASYVLGLASMGFNRLSAGIQDFTLDVQRAVNRIQSVTQTQDVLETGRRAGIRSISVDLMYGLPKQTTASFDRTLSEVIALSPDRIAVYGYAHLPKLFKAQGRINTDDLPDQATRLTLLRQAVARLCEAGYVYIGLDHFARTDDSLVKAQQTGGLQRNFQGYSTHGHCDIVGFGLSAISRVRDSYSQNAKDLTDYYSALNAGRLPITRGISLSDDDIIRRDLINELMCYGQLNTANFEQRYHMNFADYFKPELERLGQLAEDGLIEIKMPIIRTTSLGRLLLRPISMCFDAYFDHESQSDHHSRIM